MDKKYRDMIVDSGLFPEIDKKYEPEFRKLDKQLDEIYRKYNKLIDEEYERRQDNKTKVDEEYEQLLDDAYENGNR